MMTTHHSDTGISNLKGHPKTPSLSNRLPLVTVNISIIINTTLCSPSIVPRNSFAAQRHSTYL
ncbi:hypothetical protein WG66_011795 [Moniliophthora roreri]|nr:hypothetical protein WG66_011795 [Moniliophthora roreri]